MGDTRKTTMSWNEQFPQGEEDTSVHGGKKGLKHRRNDSGYVPEDVSSERSDSPEKKPPREGSPESKVASDPPDNESGGDSPKSEFETPSPPSTLRASRRYEDSSGRSSHPDSNGPRGSVASTATGVSIFSVISVDLDNPNNARPVKRKLFPKSQGEVMYERLYAIFSNAHQDGANEASLKRNVTQLLETSQTPKSLNDLLDSLQYSIDAIEPYLNTAPGIACTNIRKYVKEMRARINARDRSRELPKQTIMDNMELAFTLLFTLKNVQAKAIDEDPLEAKSGPDQLHNYITRRGRELAEKVARCNKLKLVAACALGAFAALAAIVSIATVVALLVNPTTAPVVAPIALWIAKFQIEAAVFGAVYLMGEMIYAIYNKCKQQPVLPKKPVTTTGKLLAAGVGVTGVAGIAAPVTAAFGYIPAAVKTITATSGMAEAFTGNALIPGTTVATTSQTVAGLLGGVAFTLFGSLLAIARARNAARNAWRGTNDIVLESAEKVLALNVSPIKRK